MSMPMKVKPDPRIHRRAVDQFNEAHPIGTPVIYSPDKRTMISTVTESRAWMYGDRIPWSKSKDSSPRSQSPY